jgi:hypothetical protein
MLCSYKSPIYPINGECPACHRKRLKFITYEERNPHKAQIIKIHNADVLNSMRSGNLWFQSPRFFHEYKGNGQKARADIHDARYSYIDKTGYFDDKDADSYRILCFYTLDVDEEGNLLNKPSEDLRNFGNSFSIVDVETLLVSIKNYLVATNKKISYVANWVNYLLKNYSGAYTPFCKFSKFSYQNEFRIVLLSNTFLPLGDNPYKTDPPMNNFGKVILEPQLIDRLYTMKNLNDLG